MLCRTRLQLFCNPSILFRVMRIWSNKPLITPCACVCVLFCCACVCLFFCVYGFWSTHDISWSSLSHLCYTKIKPLFSFELKTCSFLIIHFGFWGGSISTFFWVLLSFLAGQLWPISWPINRNFLLLSVSLLPSSVWFPFSHSSCAFTTHLQSTYYAITCVVA